MSPPELLSDFGAVDVAPQAPVRAGTRRILLWDLPLRVFHWALVAAVTAAIVTGEIGGPWMVWHGRAGLLIVGLLVFRAVWGVVGSVTARFASFAPTPASVLLYLRGRWRGVGHNPLGALSVFALLGLLALQATTGLFGNYDIAFAGPLNHLVSDTLGSRVTGWHRWLADGLFALMALHLLAIAFHAIVKRHDLVKPMLTGVQDVASETPVPARIGRVGRVALLVAVVLAAAAVLALAWVGSAPAVPAPAAPAATAAPAW